MSATFSGQGSMHRHCDRLLSGLSHTVKLGFVTGDITPNSFNSCHGAISTCLAGSKDGWRQDQAENSLPSNLPPGGGGGFEYIGILSEVLLSSGQQCQLDGSNFKVLGVHWYQLQLQCCSSPQDMSKPG